MLRGLAAKFPEAHVVCGSDIATQIKEADIDVTIREETQCTRKFDSPHEDLPIPGVPGPPENGYHFKDMFTSPGDSHSFSETKKVLAMPFIAPWGKTGDAIDKVLELKPEYVLPIHDWHYTQEAREWLDDLIEKALQGSGITLLPSKVGVSHVVD